MRDAWRWGCGSDLPPSAERYKHVAAVAIGPNLLDCMVGDDSCKCGYCSAMHEFVGSWLSRLDQLDPTAEDPTSNGQLSALLIFMFDLISGRKRAVDLDAGMNALNAAVEKFGLDVAAITSLDTLRVQHAI